MTKGKFSIKRLAGISGFYFAIIYIFLPVINKHFVPFDWAFWGLISFAGASIGMTVWNKKINKK